MILVPPPSAPAPRQYTCCKCDQPISRDMAIDCSRQKERFFGKFYCETHQKLFPLR
jgi:hypothetical protein